MRQRWQLISLHIPTLKHLCLCGLWSQHTVEHELLRLAVLLARPDVQLNSLGANNGKALKMLG